MRKRKHTTAKTAPVAKEKPGEANERRNKLLIGLLCIGLSAAAVVPFFFMGQSETGGAFELRMPTTHDMFLHYDQMRSFYNGLSAGEIYPRWEEDTNRGFGAPTTSYYPPGVYYVTSAFYAVTRDWMRALLDAHLVMMIAAAGALYLYARQAMGRGAAIVAMAAYIFFPYHLVDQYQRGAMAELLVFVWMPLVLLFAERLLRIPSQSSRERSMLLAVVGLAAAYGAFLWSHPPTAYQFTLGFGVYVLLLSVLRKEWKGLVGVGLAMAWGIGLGAVYLLPAAVEQNLIHKEYVAETWPYHKTYIFVHDLYNSDVHSGFFKLIDSIWITGTVIIVVAAITLLWLRRKGLTNHALRQRVLLWTILGGLASFMMTRASMPVGKLIPLIDIGVFTWRMLSITTLVVALLAGAFTQAAIDASKRGPASDKLLFAALAALIVVGSAAFSAIAVARPMSDAMVFEPESEHLNWATIPSTAPADPTELPDNVPPVQLANAETEEIVVEEWKPQHRVIRASLAEDDTLMVRTFNFPGWTAAVDGQQVPIRSSEDLGSIEIDLRVGAHRVILDFVDTKPRRTFRIVSLASLAGLIVLALAALVRTKRAGAI